MRSLSVTSLFLLPVTALQIPSLLAPFYPAYFADSALLTSNDTLVEDEASRLSLLKRANDCPNNYNSCSTLEANLAGACCTRGSVCSIDNSDQVACCRIGASCTGSISLATSAVTTTGGGGFVFGSSTSSSSSSSIPSSTSAPRITGTASYVANTFFPFPYIPTTYANYAACNSAYEVCQTNYALCTQDLEGGAGGAGITISAPNGGVTVAPTASVNLGSSSAESVCRSLSGAACYNIQSADCAQFGTATTSGFVVGTNAAARPTIGCIAAAGMMAGMGLGIAGQMV